MERCNASEWSLNDYNEDFLYEQEGLVLVEAYAMDLRRGRLAY